MNASMGDSGYMYLLIYYKYPIECRYIFTHSLLFPWDASWVKWHPSWTTFCSIETPVFLHTFWRSRWIFVDQINLDFFEASRLIYSPCVIFISSNHFYLVVERIHLKNMQPSNWISSPSRGWKQFQRKPPSRYSCPPWTNIAHSPWKSMAGKLHPFWGLGPFFRGVCCLFQGVHIL